MSALDLTGYRLTFDDEFTTCSISQTGAGTTWADIRPQWRADASSDVGFGHSSFVDPASGYDPFAVGGGALTITAVPDRTASGVPGSWESGLLTTQNGFSQTYGYFEVRADFSGARGAWDAFWLLPDTQIPDPNGAGRHQELDVVEHYGDGPRSVYSTLHTTDPAPNLHWQNDLQVYTEMAQPAGYHTYGVDWQPDTITFYVDGQATGSKPTPSDMHGPMYLLVDLATQSGGSNDADAAGVPISSRIDYVRAYAKPATIGAGPDHLVLRISEDAYGGDAQYTVSIDGRQIGGVQTAHALHGGGASDTLMVDGTWGAGLHDVAVTFLNDAYGGTPETDRNLHVDGAVYNGTNLASATYTLLSAGTQHFAIGSADPVPSTPAAPATSAPPATSSSVIGTGPDHLLLRISEDAWQGDARYTVSVDGAQVGDVQTAHASHGAGASDPLTVQGRWSVGTHAVTVTFLNDAYAGTPATDRNLYIDGAAYGGADLPGAAAALLSAGPEHFSFAVAAPAAPTIGSGPDQLLLRVSEDAYLGDARYAVSVDGVQIGDAQTAHASHGAGSPDLLAVRGDWGQGEHDVAVTFLNDAYAGTPATDRNLYVEGAAYDGVELADFRGTLLSAGPQHFHFVDG